MDNEVELAKKDREKAENDIKDALGGKGGNGIELETVLKTDDTRVTDMILESAKKIQPGFSKHVGSFCVHAYLSEGVTGKAVSYGTIIHGADMSEGLAKTCLQQLVLATEKYYNPGLFKKTRNTLDKRS